MTKKLLMLLMLALVFVACNDSEESEVAVEEEEEEELVDNYTISGTIEGAGGQILYLEAQTPNGTVSLSQFTIGQDGKFMLKGNIPGYGLYQLRLGTIPNNMILLTLVPNDDLKIEATAETFAKTPQASGTKWAKNLTDYMAILTDFRTKQAEIDAKKDKFTEDQLMAQYLKLKAPIDAFAIERLKQDPGNAFNLVLSTFAVPDVNFKNWDPENLTTLKNMAEAMNEAFEDSPMTVMLSEQVRQIEAAYENHLATSSGSKAAPEIALKNPDGKEIKLSSLRGKYVLIDFWASWCAPCRQESPNVVRMYNKYKDKGFTVYSVSLDNNKSAWKEAIAKDGLIWPNHVSDLLQWNSPMPKLYGFSGIPYTVLVNPDGKIIGTGLRGPALEQKLKDIFEK